MNWLIRPRVAGKTRAALAWMTTYPGATMVCMDAREAARLFREARRVFPFHDWRREQFVSAASVRHGGPVPRGPVVVDNADEILRALFGDVRLVTGTGEDDRHWRQG